jgi:peptidoglycan/LPS O-acetylase OafA/YrhL
MRALSYDEYLSLRRFPAFDGLRAIAALMVIFFHFDGKWAWVAGWLGVHVFFVLSGFLITTLMLREEATYGRVSIRDFYLRRAFRIIPAYYVVIAISWLVWVHMHHSPTFDGSLLYQLTFTSDLRTGAPFPHTWTVGVEQKFYLVWPLLAFSTVLLRRYRMVVTAVLAAGALIFLPSPHGYAVVHYFVLLMGCLLAMVMHDRRGFRVLSVLTSPLVALVVAVAFIAFHLALTTRIHGLTEQRVISLYAIALALLLPAVLRGGLPARFLANPVLKFIGDRSYSLYLVQILAAITAQALFPKDPRGHVHMLITVAIGLVVADVMYRWVEQPMIRLGRRLTARREAPPVPRQRVPDDSETAVPAPV